MHILCLSRTGRANKGIERDAPDVAPLDKGGLASQIRNENFDEGSWSFSLNVGSAGCSRVVLNDCALILR
jgi:hypothetical protein